MSFYKKDSYCLCCNQKVAAVVRFDNKHTFIEICEVCAKEAHGEFQARAGK